MEPLSRKIKLIIIMIVIALIVIGLSYGIASAVKSKKTSFSDYLTPYYGSDNYGN